MKINVLTENLAGGKFLAEHGLSYLIEHNGKNILFDTGHSDVFLKNASKMGFDLQKDVDAVVLSHGHWDHGDGLKFLKDKTLICHPNVFMKRYRKTDHTPVGLSSTKEELELNYKLHFTTSPFMLETGLIFLGEIPRETNFEAQTTPFIDENDEPDFVLDDSALVIIDNGALNIITGCSHSGICNIIEYAKTITNCTKVDAVIGGFHLKHNNVQTKKTIEYFKTNKIKNIYPSHCTELPALAAFYNEFQISQLKTGSLINL
ncbi:MAG: MBL fold metallo-hydrolase [Salinivirgaceae bacterium]|jgi:7,8-dihydropterin-6-yl-methyl-4-(beta-D-ribofuranosyl)aminobenzene 5'-phosphate synthase|nr:MBL fold metallo-hydrolase [Salinivirgaceae bacterium]